ncbi:thioredoxin TrxC [Xanthomonas floridensis]|uniref:Thiol reductase thioredoxin n=1 Tax=Xanthomonas floridensis TaxID=1843580 RepID=A0A1A9M956_9XANT|nr:thioredoxin TrxC [Xanthomonas floridensis]MEA5123097.1 thioredoxin TrxC [Xanthomonas floridensis]MEA5130877.1 thioredoxin TrxC [Xanthomonas floridensis]OAG66758.1 thiol reductase thioredoxin [Xanthomonas floridensis]
MTDAPLLIACPSCVSINRIARARLHDAPNCGHCHRPLFLGAPVALSAVDFDKHAVRSELPLVVDFWAPWCGPCLSMAPQFAAAAATLEPQVRLAKVDTDLHPALGTRFGIRSIPTLLVLRGGHEIGRHSGAVSSAQIISWVRSVLSQG